MVRYISWICGNKNLWALEPNIGVRKECYFKEKKLCAVVDCGGFPDQEWRDKNKFWGMK